MDFETEIERTLADRAAVAAVRGLDSLQHGATKEFVLLSIVMAAAKQPDVIESACELQWVAELEESSYVQYMARIYTDDRPMARGSRRRIFSLLREARDLALELQH